MTNRTIKIIGQGYNPTPVSAVASIDGNVVYSGTIPTVDQNIGVTQLPNVGEIQQQLLSAQTSLTSFEKDFAFNGTATVSIQAVGGPLWFGAVIANYVRDQRFNPVLSVEQQAIVVNPATTAEQLLQLRIDIANPPFTAEEITQLQANLGPDFAPETIALIDSKNASFYYRSSGPDNFLPLPDFNGTQNTTWSNVSINGVAQPTDPLSYDPPRQGVWWWTLQSGDTFVGTLEIPAGIPLP